MSKLLLLTVKTQGADVAADVTQSRHKDSLVRKRMLRILTSSINVVNGAIWRPRMRYWNV